MKPGTVVPWGQDELQYWLHAADYRYPKRWVIIKENELVREQSNFNQLVTRELASLPPVRRRFLSSQGKFCLNR